MIDVGFKAKKQRAWHAGVAGSIPHRGTTLSCVFVVDTKSYRLSRSIHNVRNNSIATDIQEKVNMEGKNGKNKRKIKDAERKVQKKETSHTT